MKLMYNGQPVLGGALAAGEGTVIEDGAVGLTNPVRGILTQAEFDALPEEEKAKGTYFVDDGQSGGSALEAYDDQERVIGTWFGKPLYRCTFTGLTAPEDDSGKDILNLSDLFVDTVVSINGGLIDSTGTIPLNCYTAPWYVSTFSRTVNGVKTIRMFATGDKHNSKVVITLEYTKTTDAEVSG